MNIIFKNEILKELQSKDLDNGWMDTNLKSTKNLSTAQRRNLIFELEREGKIVIKRTPNINDDNFPIIIINCSK